MSKYCYSDWSYYSHAIAHLRHCIWQVVFNAPSNPIRCLPSAASLLNLPQLLTTTYPESKMCSFFHHFFFLFKHEFKATKNLVLLL